MNENNYLCALKDVFENGILRKTRNSNTISKFSIKIDFDIRNSFPLLTTKKMYVNGIIQELLWFIKSDTNSKNLEKNNVNIWKGNSSKIYLERGNRSFLHIQNKMNCFNFRKISTFSI